MRQRLITAFILIPIVLGLVFHRSPFPVLTLACLFVYFSVDELWSMLFSKNKFVPALTTLGFAGIGYYVLTQGLDRQLVAAGLTTAFAFSVPTLLLLIKRKRDWKLVVPGLVWVIAPILGLLLLHSTGSNSEMFAPNKILIALIPPWIGDTFAIIFGKKYGKYALWPALSPKKTWEGAKASTLGCVLATMIICQLLGVSLWVGLVCGIISGILGIYGDLFESYLKRVSDAKDSGTILPGHGGVLDRIDSLLMPALPIVLTLLYFN